jgi:hypothetical protein
MNMPRSLPVLLLLTLGTALAADAGPPPELRGEITTGDDHRFALALPGGSQTAWVGIGETFEGWKVTDYNPAGDSLVLSKDGTEATVRLSTSIITTAATLGSTTAAPAAQSHGATKATLADAEEVLDKMKFDQMMGLMMEQQKKVATSMVKQLAAQAGVAGTSAEDQAFQGQLMETMFAELTPAAMRGDIARAYSEVFTKEELQGLANFYTSPTGQALVGKQAEISQRMMALMTPHLLAAMPKVQQMARDFAAEQAGAKKASTPAP